MPISEDKIVGPTTKLVFQRQALPSDKLDKLRQVIKDFLSAKKVFLQEIQSVIGLLNLLHLDELSADAISMLQPLVFQNPTIALDLTAM